jgi:hypothetical protein
MLTQEKLKQLYRYDPETGIWTRAPGNRGGGKILPTPGHRRRDGYLELFVAGKDYLSHRLVFLYVTGKMPPADMEVDHINRNRGDDRLVNLRIVTRAGNRKNRLQGKRPSNQSGYTGVYKNREGWCASVVLGTYQTPEEAHSARLDARAKLGL